MGTNMDPLMELPTSREKYILEALVEEVERVMIGEEEHSPSPFLPKRRAVISLAVMDDKEADKEAKEETEKEEDKGSAADGGKEEEDDIGSPFQWMDTVYV